MYRYRKLALNIFTLALSALIFTGCSKDDEEAEQLLRDIEILEKYIEDNNLNTIEIEPGIYIVQDKEGNGKRVQRTSTITLRYRGFLTNGHKFDESWTSPATFNLGGLIEGWRRSLPEFREGGEGTLLMASKFGYGNQENGDIPANSVLIFDIEVIKVF